MGGPVGPAGDAPGWTGATLCWPPSPLSAPSTAANNAAGDAAPGGAEPFGSDRVAGIAERVDANEGAGQADEVGKHEVRVTCSEMATDATRSPFVDFLVRLSLSLVLPLGSLGMGLGNSLATEA